MRDRFSATERAAMLEEARELAKLTFKRPNRMHVLAVYERLAWNRQRGQGQTGAVTVH